MGRLGFTLLEVMIASLIAAVVAGGTLMALVAAARMTAAQDSMTHAEASALAQETIETFRNEVDTDSTWLTDHAGAGWTSDDLPGTVGTESKLDTSAKRCYRVTAADCDGDGTTGECFEVQSRVCWIGRGGVERCPC